MSRLLGVGVPPLVLLVPVLVTRDGHRAQLHLLCVLLWRHLGWRAESRPLTVLLLTLAVLLLVLLRLRLLLLLLLLLLCLLRVPWP